MGDLDGQFRIYIDLDRFFLGGILETDTTQLELLTRGNYSAGRRSGHWWQNNFTFVSEGEYFNNKKTGEWKYYYLEKENDAGEVLPFSNQLFLIENYTNGRLNGVRKRYWYVYEESYTCPEEERDLARADSCYRTAFEKVFETSTYRGDQLNGLYELKDDDSNIVLKGYYVNGLKDGGWVEVELLDGYDFYEVKSKGFYNRGIKEGGWMESETFINEGGETVNVTCKGKYENNLKQGEWNCFGDETHLLTANYRSGDLEGESTFWYDGDKPKEVLVFNQGELESLAKYDRQNTVQPYVEYRINKLTSSRIDYTKKTKAAGSYILEEFTMTNNSNY